MANALQELIDTAKTLLDQVKYLTPEKFDDEEHRNTFLDMVMDSDEVITRVERSTRLEPPAPPNAEDTMSDEEYVKGLGAICPVCKGEDLEGDHIEVEEGTCYQPMVCNECESTWNDLYKLVGYGNLKKGEPEE